MLSKEDELDLLSEDEDGSNRNNNENSTLISPNQKNIN